MDNFTYREISNGYMVEANAGYKIKLKNPKLKNPYAKRAVLKSIDDIEIVKDSSEGESIWDGKFTEIKNIWVNGI